MRAAYEQEELFSDESYFVEQQKPEQLFFPQGVAMQQLCDGNLRRPGEAYALYVRNRRAMQLDAPDYYFSTTITTGGFMRDPDVSFAEGMQLNHQLARGLADGVIDRFELDPRAVMLPSDLGKVAGWSQSDFLLFWVHVIYGSSETSAESLDEKFDSEQYQTLTNIMSDRNLSENLRRQAYRDMMRYMESILLSGDSTPGVYNRPLLVPLVDDEFSLGCFGEKEWRSRWRNPLALWNSGRKPGDPALDTALLRVYPELAQNWEHAPQHPAKLNQVNDTISPETALLIDRAHQLGATVMGSTYDHESAQAWADYFEGELVQSS